MYLHVRYVLHVDICSVLCFFKDYWNQVEFATLVLSFVTIVMFTLKTIAEKLAIHDLKNRKSGKT